ncbi:phosphate transport system permease protein [Streptosporangium becharense]|uniref:Phosphate transport system permease protein PstA n=1 Tax=Streptosporangium becharense TaxID=1816182 RepID=A0A7W9IJN3_9ACTN|nr:phosphate ABC transporter permease PstA [Streptosporangium becharense]MBB2915524.1 phosphate transport system permease protein [Streptosporangium becharense]MBB5821274.1 phosphate transport system permease protein [Streptosporangium becharense]
MAILTTPRSAVQLASKGRPLKEHLFRIALLTSLAIALIFLAMLLIYVVNKGWPRLNSMLWENQPSIRRPETSGIQSGIFGTLWIIGLTALMALPTGILAAVYLEEYADKTKWYNKLIELNISNLAAVPSIVYGILGLGIIARWLQFGFTVMTGAVTISLLVLPIVIISAREAIRAVPPSIREGSLALGATQWQTIYRQVLPASIPGIATGSILALSRAIGEAAPFLMLGAATLVRFNPEGVWSSFTVLPLQIYSFITRPQAEFSVLAAAAIVILLAILLLMNSVAIWLRNRYQKRW